MVCLECAIGIEFFDLWVMTPRVLWDWESEWNKRTLEMKGREWIKCSWSQNRKNIMLWLECHERNRMMSSCYWMVGLFSRNLRLRTPSFGENKNHVGSHVQGACLFKYRSMFRHVWTNHGTDPGMKKNPPKWTLPNDIITKRRSSTAPTASWQTRAITRAMLFLVLFSVLVLLYYPFNRAAWILRPMKM